MKEVSIEIKGIEYKLRQSFRTFLIFEEETGKQVGDISTMKDNIMLIYCTFKGCNKNFIYSFDEFLDILDENNEIFEIFNKLNLQDAEDNTEKKK